MPYSSNGVDGTRIYFEDDGGDGVPTVILGGFLDPVPVVRRWPLAVALGARREQLRLVYVDHRGHGRSDAPREPEAYEMRHRVDDVISVLDALGLERAHVVGLSWGARLGFGIVELAPERVRSLIAVGQHPYRLRLDGPLARTVEVAVEATRERGIVALVEAFEAIVGRYPDAIRTLYLRSDDAAIRAAWHAAVAEGAVSERLHEWRVPCLICVADGDVDFHDDARRAAEEIPSAEFLVVGGADHLGMDTAEVGPFLPAVLATLRRGG